MAKLIYNQQYVIGISLTIALGSFNAGYQIGVMNSLREFFRIKMQFTDSERWDHIVWPLINTVLTIFAAISSFFGNSLAKSFGRTNMMHFTNVITIIASIVIQVKNLLLQWSFIFTYRTSNIRNCYGVLSISVSTIYI